MKPLSARAKALIEAAREVEAPDGGERQRVRARLCAALGTAAFAASHASTGQAIAAAAKSGASTGPATGTATAGGAARPTETGASTLGTQATRATTGATRISHGSAVTGTGSAVTGTGFVALGVKLAAYLAAAALSAALGGMWLLLHAESSIDAARSPAAERAHRDAPAAGTPRAARTQTRPSDVHHDGSASTPPGADASRTHTGSGGGVPLESAAAPRLRAGVVGSRSGGALSRAARAKRGAATARSPASATTRGARVQSSTHARPRPPHSASSTSGNAPALRTQAGAAVLTTRVASQTAKTSPASPPASDTAAPSGKANVAAGNTRTSKPAGAAPAAPQRPQPAAAVTRVTTQRAAAARESSGHGVAAPERDARATNPATLSAELDWLTRAQRALQAGRPREALSLLDAHARQYPRGSLREERMAARAVVLCRLGEREAGRAEAARLRSLTPRSPLWPWVRAACER